jgi:hypothetical protein
VTLNWTPLEGTEYEVAEVPPESDWSFLEDPEAMKVVERAARSIAEKYTSTATTEYDDAYQDGLMLMATNAGLRRTLADSTLGYGALYRALCQDLINKHKYEAEKRSPARLTSWESNAEKLIAQGYC